MGQGPGEFGLVADVVRDAAAQLLRLRVRRMRSHPEVHAGRQVHRCNGAATATEPGQFMRPQHLEFDADGLLWVADACNHRIQVFDRAGKFVKMWGTQGSETGPAAISVLPGARRQGPRLRLRIRQPPRAEVHARRQIGRLLGQRRPQAGAAQHARGHSCSTAAAACTCSIR